jgi:tetratricopeptide (TPR) repeat protein
MKLYIIYILSLILIVSCSNVNTTKKSLYERLTTEDVHFEITLDSSSKNNILNDYFISGKTLQQQGKYSESIFEFQAALQYDTSVVILQAIAESFYLLGKHDLALDYLLNSIRLNDSYMPSLDLLERIYFQKFDIKKSIMVLEKVIEVDPKNDQNKVILANLFELQNPNRSIELYESVINPVYKVSALQRLSQLYINKKLNDKYISTIEQLIEIENDKNKYFFILLNEYNKQKNYDKSFNLINKYDHYLDYKEFTNCYYNIGLSLLNDNKETISKYYPVVLQKIDSPEYSTWYLNMISMYIYDKLEDSTLTKTYMNRLYNFADSIPEASLEISHFYRQKNNIELSQEILLNYKRKFAKDVRFYLSLAGIYFYKQEFKKVVETYNEVLLFDTNNVNVWIELGLAHNRLRDYEKSDIAYEKAIFLDPNNPLANNNFAYSLSERGLDLERAEKMIKLALEVDPKNPSYLDSYAWILFKMEKYHEALKYIYESIETGNPASEVYEHLGDILYKMGKKIDALNAYEKGLKINPEDSALINKVKEFK